MCHRGGRTGLFDWSFDLLLMDVAPPGALFLVCVGIRQERILGKVLATIDSDGQQVESFVTGNLSSFEPNAAHRP